MAPRANSGRPGHVAEYGVGQMPGGGPGAPQEPIEWWRRPPGQPEQAGDQCRKRHNPQRSARGGGREVARSRTDPMPSGSSRRPSPVEPRRGLRSGRTSPGGRQVGHPVRPGVRGRRRRPPAVSSGESTSPTTSMPRADGCVGAPRILAQRRIAPAREDDDPAVGAGGEGGTIASLEPDSGRRERSRTVWRAVGGEVTSAGHGRGCPPGQDYPGPSGGPARAPRPRRRPGASDDGVGSGRRGRVARCRLTRRPGRGARPPPAHSGVRLGSEGVRGGEGERLQRARSAPSGGGPGGEGCHLGRDAGATLAAPNRARRGGAGATRSDGRVRRGVEREDLRLATGMLLGGAPGTRHPKRPQKKRPGGTSDRCASPASRELAMACRPGRTGAGGHLRHRRRRVRTLPSSQHFIESGRRSSGAFLDGVW